MEIRKKDVAAWIGVTRSVYNSLETGETQACDPEVLDKLAALYRIPVSDLLDGYSRFLRTGQGQAIQQLCAPLNMTREQFADHLQTDVRNILAWETEKKRISRRMWERYFKKLSMNLSKNRCMKDEFVV